MEITYKNVYYQYGSGLPYVLNDINLSFESGKTYAVKGASGSGKTTLILLAARMDNPTKGKILFDGTDITGLNENEYRARKSAVIFQNYNLLMKYSTVENITSVLHTVGYKGDYKKHAMNLLEKVNLPAEKHCSLVKDLSGGEKQRVAIARAMAQDAAFVFADEPTGNLDEANERCVIDLLIDYAKRDKKCVVIVTHSNHVSSYCDVIVNVQDGRVCQ